MSAVERAMDRGRKAAATRGKATVEPVAVKWRGRLIAEVAKNGGEPEGAQIIGGQVLYYQLAQDKEGRTYQPAVRDAPTRRVVRAMIEPDDQDELFELIADTFSAWRDRSREQAEAAEPKAVKRGAKS